MSLQHPFCILHLDKKQWNIEKEKLVKFSYFAKGNSILK